MTLNFGVVGAGGIGKTHIERLMQRVSGAAVTAVADINVEGTKSYLQEKNWAIKVYETDTELINDPEVDAIVVSSWGPAHAGTILQAIEAGKYIFSEKPLATTAEDCQRIVDAEMKHGKRLVQVGFMRRFDEGYVQLKEAIDSGLIGEPLLVNAQHFNPTVPDSYTTDMAITDTVIHEIDVLHWLVNDDYESVEVSFPRQTRNKFDHLADPQIVRFETKNKIALEVQVFVNTQYGYDIQCQVVGENGVLDLPEFSTVRLRKDFKVSTGISEGWNRFTRAYDTEFQAFVDTIQEKGQPAFPSAWDGYVAAVTADACVKAQTSKQRELIVMPEKPAFYQE